VAAARIAQRARRQVERYSWAYARRAWMEVYAQAADSGTEAA
jgi:hypothetical protein